MKKAVMIGMALGLVLAGPAAFAAGPAGGAQGNAGMQQGQKSMAPKAMEHKPMKKKSRKTMHHRFSTEQVKAIQEALNNHGAKLEADGRWGKETRQAIKGFQKENGLRATGYANKKTRAKLGVTF